MYASHDYIMHTSHDYIVFTWRDSSLLEDMSRR